MDRSPSIRRDPNADAEPACQTPGRPTPTGTDPEGRVTEPLILDDEAIEAVARAYHERYRLTADATVATWDELDEGGRAANRASARAVPAYLDALGWRPVPDGGVTPPPPIPRDALERLARREHDRWAEHTRGRGYVWGPVRDDDADPPTHPHLVGWDALDEPTRDKDRDRIRSLPRVLAAAGYSTVPADPAD